MLLCPQDLCQKCLSPQVIYLGWFYSYLLQSFSRNERDAKWYLVLQRDVWILLLDLALLTGNVLGHSQGSAEVEGIYFLFS